MAPRFPAATRAAALGLCVGLAADARLDAAEQLLDVLVRDEVGVPPEVLRNARSVAGRIVGETGVAIVWLDPESGRAVRAGLGGKDERGFLMSLHTVRVVADAAGNHPGVAARASLGFTAVDTRQAIARYRRIEDKARQTGADVASILGHVVAHELGHLLLRRATHSAAGIMQATLDVTRASQGRLAFSAAERAAIRARVLALPHRLSPQPP